MVSSQKAAVIGGGSWGTALAIVLARKQTPVSLWVHDPELCQRIAATRENPTYLSGIVLPESIHPTHCMDEALAGAALVLTVMPSHTCRTVLGQMIELLQPQTMLLSATKGLEDQTLMRMSEVIADVLRPRFEPRIGVLSGPSFAREVAQGDPTAIVVASSDDDLAHAAQVAMSGPTFRVYTSTDVVGVELAASLKNVIAIAAGICTGLGLGSNSVAALISRGLAEMSRLACACGGQAETMAGLAGLGDLVLTCTGGLSRNRSVGEALGRGETLARILGSMKMVAEGVKTTAAALELARRHHVELPITEQMYRVLFEDRSPREAIRELMERSLKPEW